MAERHASLLRHLRRLVPSADRCPESDRELLRRFSAGRDEASFAALLQRHGPMVLAVCRRVLHHEQDAEDAFQATFLVLARKARSPWQESVGNWLHGVAYRLALKARTAAARRRAHERRVPAHTSNDPLTEVTGRELLTLLDKELLRLPGRYREPLVLCLLEGATRDEAARRLGCSTSTLKRRLECGRELLRQRLARRGLSLSAALLAGGLGAEAAALLPAPLVATTTQLATADAVPVQVAELAGEMVRSGTGRVRAAAILLLLAGAVGLGAGLSLCQPPPPPQTPATREAPEPRPPEPQRTDLHGDPLPAKSVARLGTLRWRLNRLIGHSITFTPDGKKLLTTNSFGEIDSWDAVTGRNLGRVRAETVATRDGEKWERVSRVVPSADGSTVAFGMSDGTVRVIDAGTGKERWCCPGHKEPVNAIALSADGRVMATRSPDDFLRLWDLVVGKKLCQIETPVDAKHRSPAVAVSPDGRTVAWANADDRTIRVVDVATGAEQHQLAPDSISHFTFVVDGKTLAAKDGRSIRLWDLTTSRQIRTFAPLPPWERLYQGFFHLVASPDGTSLAASTSELILVWDVATGEERCRIPARPHIQDQLAFAPDGKTLVVLGKSDWDLTIYRYDVAKGKKFPSPEGHEGPILSLTFTPDGRRLYSGGNDATLRVWDPVTGKPLGELPGELAWLPDAFSADTRRVLEWPILSTDLRVTEADTRREICRLEDTREKRQAVKALSPDGRVVATSGTVDGPVILWDVATGKELHRLQTLSGGSTMLLFSPEGETLAGFSWAPRKEGSETEGVIIQFWETATGRPRTALSMPHKSRNITFSPNGRSLAAADWEGKTVRIWELATGQQRLHIDQPGQADRLLFSPDGGVLLTGGWKDPSGERGSPVRGWDPLTGRRLFELPGHRGAVTALAISPDGRRMASGSQDTTVLIWDLESLRRTAAREPQRIADRDWPALWEDLRGEAPKAGRALARLVESPEQAVSLLRGELRPAEAADARHLTRLLADLDDDRFEVRQKAATELEELGELAVPALRRAAEGKPSAEARRQFTRLLDRLENAAPPADVLRAVRAVELLERIGSADAREVLESLANGAQETRLTREAAAASRRLADRRVAGR